MRLTVEVEGRTERPEGTTIVLGRDTSCDVRLSDPRVSRRHLLFEFADGVWRARDLGGANGTFLDGEPYHGGPLIGRQTFCLGADRDATTVTVGVVDDAGELSRTRIRRIDDATGPGDRTPPLGRLVATIGRDPSNSVQVSDLLISRFHAQIRQEGSGLIIRDLDSRNGTYVNGRRVSTGPFGPGDLLTVGSHQFHLHGDELVRRVDEGNVWLSVDDLTFSLPNGKVLLERVAFTLSPASLTAVIGPSGAGKSTLFRILAGTHRPTFGVIEYEGRDLYANLAELQHRMGVVPQEDLVHSGLTVRQALSYAAELRFPADTRADARAGRVQETMAELGLDAHADTRVDRLSGGQRKRTSVAMELLTRPALLFLDEPTSGLDPGLDKQVMTTLRHLADGGRTVLVVTHAVANLGVCDRVVLLAPGGRMAYVGPPAGLLSFMGRSDYADVFADLAARPDEAAQRYDVVMRPRAKPVPHSGQPETTTNPQAPIADVPRQSRRRQLSTLIRRQLRVLAADGSYAAFILLLPVILALLTLAVPGSSGWQTQHVPIPSSEPLQLLDILIVGAAFMGTTTSARELIGERAIFRREAGVGLAPNAYLLSKVVVFAGLSAVQSAVLTGLVLLRKPAAESTVVIPSPALELWVVVAATTFAGCLMGLAISAWVTSADQVMPLLVASVMAQLVLCGGLISITGRPVLAQLAWAMPARWGYAAAASSTDVRAVVPASPDDSLWAHDGATFALNLTFLMVLGLVYLSLTGVRLHRDARRR